MNLGRIALCNAPSFLCDLEYGQVGGDRFRASCGGSEDQIAAGPFGIADGKNRVFCRGCHKGDTHQLGSGGAGTADDGIGQLCTVQCQFQLARAGCTGLELDQIGAGTFQTESGIADAGDSCGTDGSGPGEGNVSAGRDGIRIIRRNQGVEISEAQQTAGNPLRSGWACGALKSGRSLWSGCTCRTLWSGQALWSLRTGRAGIADGSLWASGTGRPRCTLRAGGAGLTLRTLGADGALGSGGTGHTLRPLRSGWAPGSGNPLRTLGASGTHRALGTGRADTAVLAAALPAAVILGAASPVSRIVWEDIFCIREALVMMHRDHSLCFVHHSMFSWRKMSVTGSDTRHPNSGKQRKPARSDKESGAQPQGSPFHGRKRSWQQPEQTEARARKKRCRRPGR